MYTTTKPYLKEVEQLIANTWPCNPFITCFKEGEYTLFRRNSWPPESYDIDHTDGIGTKGLLHWTEKSFPSAVEDALAMNINDLTTQHAVPYKLQNHLIVPEDDHQAILEIIKILSVKCCTRQIAITGGEISVQNNLEGMDLSITMSGYVKNYVPNHFLSGDTLVALPSNGLHCNGFTKIRELFKKEEYGRLVRPTCIYNLEKFWDKVNGIVHIAGGGLTRIKPFLEKSQTNATLILPSFTDTIFAEIFKRGVGLEEMCKTFNCGIGMLISVSKKNLAEVLHGLAGQVVGEVMTGKPGKVIIDFDNKKIEL